jgi:hypothetical protein
MIPGPYFGAGSGGEVIFFIVIGLIWLIGSLLKKASEASKRTGGVPPRPQMQGGTGGGQRRPSLTDFLRRLQEMSQEQAEPRPPQPPQVERPQAATPVRTPPSLRRPAVPERKVAHAEALRRPKVQRVQKPMRPPEPRPVPQFELHEVELPEVPLTPSPVFPTAPEAPKVDAYAMKAAKQPHVTEILGADMSASEVRKGIVLAEILGRPKALRGRRPTAGRV